MHLRSSLCELKQGDLSISEYFIKALLIKYELADIEKEPTYDDFLCQVLSHLKPEFTKMRTSILARPTVPDFEEVMDLLLTAESMMDQSHFPSPSSALVAPDPPITKILESITDDFNNNVCAIKEANNGSEIPINELMGNLMVAEMVVAKNKARKEANQIKPTLTLKSTKSFDESPMNDEEDKDDEISMMTKQFNKYLKFQRNR
ncbi:hypothetical protein LIER_25683 [Lithospermum erythrorhizon]|uniref:UBN2 domain-containing protein n=1 Tax=Lithospermum erythrorhizon TaxID=34254 RepID=A0AAV3R913_LITER